MQRAGGCREGAESAESAEGLNEGCGGGGCGVRVGACECLCACETLCERSSGMSFICVVRVAAQVGVAEQVSVAAQVGVVAQVGVQVSWAGALTGMPSLVRCLFILITTGSSGPGVLSSGVATGDASASMD